MEEHKPEETLKAIPKKFYKNKRFIITALLLMGGGYLLYSIFSNDQENKYVFTEAVSGEITQVVDVTGTIKADPTIDLHFQKSGTIKDISVEKGDKVNQGDLLASLENESLELQIERQRANLQHARAQYNKTKAGAKYEEILIAQADLESAEASFDAALTEKENIKKINESNLNLASIEFKQAEQNKEAAYEEYLNTKDLAEKEIAKLDVEGEGTQEIALISAYKRVQTQLDSMFPVMQESLFLAEKTIGVRGTGFFLISQSNKTKIKNNYHAPANQAYALALDIYQSLPQNPSNEEIDEAMDATLNAADKILFLLSQLGYELEKLPYDRDDLNTLILEVSSQSTKLSTSIMNLRDTQTTILNIKTGSSEDIDTLKLTYKLQIDAAKSKYDSARNALSQAAHKIEQARNNAEIANKNADAFLSLKKAAVEVAKANLSLKRSPARDVDLAPLLANIAQAEIALKMAESEYRDSQLFAPIDGIITFIHGEKGENVALTETALKSFITLQSDNLIVRANVPETDVSKINKGDEVVMTIDAFDFTEKFDGEVVYIDPAETIVQGVIYYGIETAFTIEDERIKSGMTTNLDIITDKKTDILKIPIRALRYEDSIKYVEVLKNGEPEKVTVTTGVEGDQYVEITSGLEEGDKIITFIN